VRPAIARQPNPGVSGNTILYYGQSVILSEKRLLPSLVRVTHEYGFHKPFSNAKLIVPIETDPFSVNQGRQDLLSVAFEFRHPAVVASATNLVRNVPE
jgi:hypothetical protein